MKKWISLLVVSVLILFAGNVGGAAAAVKPAPAPKLYLDGKLLKPSVPPVIVKSSILVPIRLVVENLGYGVEYDSSKKQVTANRGNTIVEMTINNPKAKVNGKTVTMASPPILKSGTTLIPIRFVTEAFGLQIVWDQATRSAFLYTDASAGDNGSGTGAQPGGGSGDAGTDTGSGTGSDTGSVPQDGGLIGVVDGSEGTDGSGETGSDPAAPTVPAAPDVYPSYLHQIDYQTDAVVLTYEGTAAPAAHVLTGPDRIVIDFPNMNFAGDFTADQNQVFSSGLPSVGEIYELPVSGHPALQKIRYSQYQAGPDIVRVVLDLSQPWGYNLVNDPGSGVLTIQLKQPQQPVKTGYTVVLDAGHGGSDPGAPSVVGRWEKEFNLIMVRKVKALLQNEPKIHLVLTREGDTYPTLDDRVNLANSLKADLFLSIHANSYYKATNGTETYYTRSNSQAFAKLLQKNAVGATGFKDGGVRVAGFKVIKYTTMPAVLLEAGYLSNDNDGPKLFTEALQNRLAAAIATSIKQYFHL